MRLINFLLVLAGIAGLIGVRMYEERMFYDPILDYFQIADDKMPLPYFNDGKLILHHIFRFALNLFFSLIIVQALFRNFRWTVQAAVLMALVFLITFPLYYFSIKYDLKLGFLFTFYLRRFVIQPLILLLIIPIFYYRKQEAAA